MSDAVNLRIDPRNGEKNWTGLISETLTVGEFEELPGVFGVLLTQVPHPTSIEVYKATDPSVPLTRITTIGEPGAAQFWSDSQQLKPRGYVIVNDSLDGDDLIIIYRGGGYLAHKRVLEDVIPVGPPGPSGGVNTVFGRAGAVVAVSGDYTQDLVTDGSTYKQFSATEKTKLSGISSGADVTAAAIAPAINAATQNASPAVASKLGFWDSVANALRYLTFDNLKALFIISGTTQATTSGTSIDFTGLPSTAKRITIMFNGVSTNGTSYMQLQLGDSGGIETSGYTCQHGYTGPTGNGFAASTGFAIYRDNAAQAFSGALTLTLLDAATNLWACTGWLASNDTYARYTAGDKATSGTLDRIRLTTVNGTDAFDAGKINILYE